MCKYDNVDLLFTLIDMFVLSHKTRSKINVWTGILRGRIVGPFFYEGNLNAERFHNLLDQSIVPEILELVRDQEARVIFQMDGAPAHNAIVVQEFVRANYDNRFIANNGPIRWPVRSPDLAPCDFFLWPFVKEKLYNGLEFPNIATLVGAINEQCAGIIPEMIQNVIAGFEKIIWLCIELGGGIFKNHLK